MLHAVPAPVAYFNSTTGPSTNLDVTLDNGTLATVEVPGRGAGLTVRKWAALKAGRVGTLTVSCGAQLLTALAVRPSAREQHPL